MIGVRALREKMRGWKSSKSLNNPSHPHSWLVVFISFLSWDLFLFSRWLSALVGGGSSTAIDDGFPISTKRRRRRKTSSQCEFLIFIPKLTVRRRRFSFFSLVIICLFFFLFSSSRFFRYFGLTQGKKIVRIVIVARTECFFHLSRLPFPLGAFIHLVRARQKDRDQTKTDEGGKTVKRWWPRVEKKANPICDSRHVSDRNSEAISQRAAKGKRQKFRSSRPRDSLLCDMCVCCCCSTTVNPKGILTAATVDLSPLRSWPTLKVAIFLSWILPEYSSCSPVDRL
jgi:hypothetical protein